MNDIICARCKNFINSEKRFNKCKAFPESPGIPWKIISGKDDHAEPLPNQKNNIVFESKEE